VTLYENKSPSPDGRENPFVPGFGIKDWKEQQEIAPYSLTKIRMAIRMNN